MPAPSPASESPGSEEPGPDDVTLPEITRTRPEAVAVPGAQKLSSGSRFSPP
ncbi:hypothetical protein ACRAWF_20135 [Streptomyces sp. L7]